MAYTQATARPEVRLLRHRELTPEQVWIPNALLDSIKTEAAQWAPYETGGALVGYEAEGGLVVTNHVEAGPDAKRTRTVFQPDGDYQLREIARIYEESGRISTFIGDWHTHPASSPASSRVDRAALRSVSVSEGARCSRPLMLILGGGDLWVAVAWRYTPGLIWGHIDAMSIRPY